MIRRHINHAPLLLALLLALAGVSRQAWADFDDGMRAYLHHQDYATALQEWRPLAEQGDPRAQSMLGVMYHFGQGVPRDYTEAAQWYRRAADQGNAKAQHNLGVLYANGEGVPQNDAIAVQWFRKAAEQGNAGAQVALGSRYTEGRGVPQNDAMAAQWFRKAAEQGDTMAQNNLAVIYEHGRGVPQDYGQALRWYHQAAEQGEANAQMGLGGMYANGRGVPQDYVQAHLWLNLAAAKLPPGTEREQVVYYRDLIARSMTSAQLAQAQELARTWEQKTVTTEGHLVPWRMMISGEYGRILRAQKRLNVLGFNPGLLPMDGTLGLGMRDALRRFQRTKHLPVTGELDEKTLDMLGVQ